MHRQPTKNH